MLAGATSIYLVLSSVLDLAQCLTLGRGPVSLWRMRVSVGQSRVIAESHPVACVWCPCSPSRGPLPAGKEQPPVSTSCFRKKSSNLSCCMSIYGACVCMHVHMCGAQCDDQRRGSLRLA